MILSILNDDFSKATNNITLNFNMSTLKLFESKQIRSQWDAEDYEMNSLTTSFKYSDI